MSIIKGILGAAVTLAVIGAIIGSVNHTTSAPAATTDLAQIAPPAATQTSAPAKHHMTAGQANALESAQSYLQMGGFSRHGLIEQLTSNAGEGFSHADATYAVNHAHANWNQQAVQSARSYLDMGGFSRSSLTEQLTSNAGEGFTQAQASYAVGKTYR